MKNGHKKLFMGIFALVLVVAFSGMAFAFEVKDVAKDVAKEVTKGVESEAKDVVENVAEDVTEAIDETVTISGTVSEDSRIVDINGEAFNVVDTEVGKELLGFVGKKVEVKGTVMEHEGAKMITVSSYQIIEEEAK